VAGVRIGELLVQQGLLTPGQLQQALAAQQIFGGRLGTNLVEQGFVSEVDLARLLSKQLGIRMVQPHELSDIDPDVIALIGPEIARRHAVVPFRFDEMRGKVALAMADPTNLQKVDELQFALGKTVDFFICPEVMLAFAMEKYYGIERPRRYVRLAGMSDVEMQLAQDERGRVPRAGAGGGPARIASRDALLKAVMDAPDKKRLVETVVDILGGFAGQVAFLALRGDELMGWASRGLPLPLEQLRQVRVPLPGPEALRRVIEGLAPELVEGVPDGELRTLLEGSLFLDASRPVLMLPLILNHRVFGVFALGDLTGRDLAADVALLTELLKRVSYRLQVFYLVEQITAPL
jgi:hypothetical protein